MCVPKGDVKMAIFGKWQTIVWDIDATATGEFSGYDADKHSQLIDLGQTFEKVLVIIPTITSATISIAIVPEDGTALKLNVPVPLYILDDDATGSFLQATTAATTTNSIVFAIGGARYIRLYSSANQAADRTFYVRGIRS